MKQKLSHSWDVLRTWLLSNGWTTTLVNFQSDLVATVGRPSLRVF